jgi:FtsZ-binding cell division protein ZapB
MPTGYRVKPSDLYATFFQAPTAPNQPPAASQKSDKLQALIKELRETSKKLSQEQEEMEGALEKLTTLTEVVKETGTAVQRHISILQKAAIHLLTETENLLPQGLSGSDLGSVQVDSPPAAAPQPAEAGEARFVPGLWLRDQG